VLQHVPDVGRIKKMNSAGLLGLVKKLGTHLATTRKELKERDREQQEWSVLSCLRFIDRSPFGLSEDAGKRAGLAKAVSAFRAFDQERGNRLNRHVEDLFRLRQLKGRDRPCRLPAAYDFTRRVQQGGIGRYLFGHPAMQGKLRSSRRVWSLVNRTMR